MWRRSWKTVRVSEDGGRQGNRAFDTQQDWQMYELTEVEAACPGPAEIQVRWGPSNEKGSWAQASIPNQEPVSN